MTDTLIVDGYNIMRSIPELDRAMDIDLRGARKMLEFYLLRYSSRERSIKRIYIVYDGKDSINGGAEDAGMIKNIFSPSSSNADREIVNLLKKTERPDRVAVLSRDNFVINHTRVMGARPVPMAIFKKKISDGEHRFKNEPIDEGLKHKINLELKKLWGLE
ncbi:MAG: NYN domain-containing protein [Candidatus Omnitrophica bacterium]|nr:NYN domain-containing protein [Candidatus Omnitrophota bacterium]